MSRVPGSGRGGTGAPGHGVVAGPRAHDHVVGFYESEAFLTTSVVDFLGPALELNDAAIVVATPEHRERIDEALTVEGFDVGSARHRGQLLSIDAAELLADVTVDDAPDPARFRTVVGGLIDRATTGGRTVRIHGEMVALLSVAGNMAGAIAMEDLWNEVTDARPSSLLCTYPLRAFARQESTAAFRTVCQQHSAVIPGEGYSDVEDVDDRRRAVASLQQEVRAAAHARAALETKEDELRATRDRLVELDRLRNEFVAMVAHDIRNPATVITGLLQVVRDHRADLDDERVHWLLTRAMDNADAIRRLTDDIMTVSRLESGAFTYDLRPIDLTGVIEAVAEELRTASGREIDVVLDPPPPPVLADEQRQSQILRNLLTNAVNFSSETSTVTVTTTTHDDHVVVAVRDEGVGITPDEHDRLFRPFARLGDGPERRSGESEAATGIGLGLYITEALVEGQGGTIRLDSAPGRGSTFSYTVLRAGRPAGTR